MNRPTNPVVRLFLPVCLLASATLFGQDRVERDVVFAPEGDACVMTSQPTTIHAKKNSMIIWRVNNRCNREIDVEVGNFSFDGQPVEPPVSLKPVRVTAGQNQPIIGRVASDAKVGTYSYEVLLQGSQAQDPELVIDP